MLTKTTISAVRALIYLGHKAAEAPQTPRHMAEQLGESPTYLAKVTRLLVRAGILRAQRGMAGGVLLARPRQDITLLSVVEACQGALLGDYCGGTAEVDAGCAFHQAGAELHRAIVGVLSRWRLSDLLARPCPLALHLTGECLLTKRGFAKMEQRPSETTSKRRKAARRTA